MSLLEKNFESIITTDNILTQNDSNIMDIQGKIDEDRYSLKLQSEEFLLDDSPSKPIISFKQLKSNFENLYTNSYIQSIPLDYEKMKIEIKNAFKKMNEISKSYHEKVKKKQEKYHQMRNFYVDCAIKYMNLQKKMSILTQKMREIEVQEKKRKLVKKKALFFDCIQKEIGLFREASFPYKEKNKKEYLRKIIFLIGRKNIHLLNKTQFFYIKKLRFKNN